MFVLLQIYNYCSIIAFNYIQLQNNLLVVISAILFNFMFFSTCCWCRSTKTMLNDHKNILIKLLFFLVGLTTGSIFVILKLKQNKTRIKENCPLKAATQIDKDKNVVRVGAGVLPLWVAGNDKFLCNISCFFHFYFFLN